MTTMRADLPEAMEALEKWLRKPPSALRSMYRAGSRESYADEARELAEAAKAAAIALRALRDAPVGVIENLGGETWELFTDGRRPIADIDALCGKKLRLVVVGEEG